MNKFSIPQPVSILPTGLWGLRPLAPGEEYKGMPANMTLVTGGRSDISRRMHALIVELALAGPIKVLIGGNRYDHYQVNYALAATTACYEYILEHHIYLTRAETCYQMVELLSQTRADPLPVLVMDLLAAFEDEGVPESEISQLLFETTLQLRRLSREAAVVVSAHAGQNRPRLLEALKKTVDRVEEPPAPSFQPMRQQLLIG